MQLEPELLNLYEPQSLQEQTAKILLLSLMQVPLSYAASSCLLCVCAA